MLFKLLLATTILLFFPSAYAQDANTQTAVAPLDLIEILGEIDAEDAESLEAALSQVEIKKTEVKGSQAKAYPQEIKK
jgi:2'-5' RNA ligase